MTKKWNCRNVNRWSSTSLSSARDLLPLCSYSAETGHPDLSVVVWKRARKWVRISSPAQLFDPIGIDRLLPGWREEEGHPFKTESRTTVSVPGDLPARFACRTS